MSKTLVAILALVTCAAASVAYAQSPDAADGTGGGQAPTLIMPGLLTNPLTSGSMPRALLAPARRRGARRPMRPRRLPTRWKAKRRSIPTPTRRATETTIWGGTVCVSGLSDWQRSWQAP
jgi:hypothetical protein